MPDANSTDALIARLDRWLQTHRPEYYASLQPGATDADLDVFEARYELVLPAAFRALYRWRDGQRGSKSLVDNRMFMSLRRIASTRDMLDPMIGYDFEAGWWRTSWVPFLDNGGGDYLCIDLEAEDGGMPGQIFPFWHDDGDFRDPTHPSFEAWLHDLVTSMEDGTYTQV
ncbi:MAG: SMI1/KNR4 family protein [Rubricoccaceae bacterium]